MSTLRRRFAPNVIPEWHNRANCNGIPTDTFYPEKGYTADYAKTICRRCEVTTECLDYALTNGEPGVWGGTTEKERRQMRRTAA